MHIPQYTRYPHMKIGEKLEPYVSKGISFLTGIKGGVSKEPLVSFLKPPAPSWVVSAVAEAPTWAFFSPFMRIGTYQEQESVL